MTDCAFPVSFRQMRESDRGFVVSGWLRSYSSGTGAMRAESMTRYKPSQRAVIDAAIARGTCLVACSPDDDDALYGFAVATSDSCAGCGRCQGRGVCGELHYVYVIQTRRRQGLARALLVELASRGLHVRSYTHRTVTGDRVLSKMGLGYAQHGTVRLLHAHQEDLRSRWDSGGHAPGHERQHGPGNAA